MRLTLSIFLVFFSSLVSARHSESKAPLGSSEPRAIGQSLSDKANTLEQNQAAMTQEIYIQNLKICLKYARAIKSRGQFLNNCLGKLELLSQKGENPKAIGEMNLSSDEITSHLFKKHPQMSFNEAAAYGRYLGRPKNQQLPAIATEATK